MEQLEGWARHYSRQPWGGRELDLQMAALRRMMAATAGAKRLGDLEEFMLHPPPEDPRGPAPEETAVALDAIFGLSPPG